MNSFNLFTYLQLFVFISLLRSKHIEKKFLIERGNIYNLRIRHILFMKEDEFRLLDSKPLFDVEVSSECNARCVFCPRDLFDSIKTKLMTKETMKMVSEWIPRGSSVMVSGVGEPLLNPNLEVLIHFLRSRDVNVSIITNGSLLNDHRIRTLIDSGVNEIQVSFQSIIPQKYSDIMIGLDYQVVANNIKRLSEIGSSKIKLRLNSVSVMTHDEQNSFVEYAKSIGFVPFIRNVHSRGGLLYAPNIQSESCGIFPSTTVITTDGDIMMCANNRLGSGIGTIGSTSFHQILEIKRKMLSQPMSDICKMCDDEYRWIILKSGDVHKIKSLESKE